MTLSRIEPWQFKQRSMRRLTEAKLPTPPNRSGKQIGHFYYCPWSPVYVVKYPVTIAGRRLRTLQEFTFVVDADEVLEGGEFERQILVGSFQPTTEIGYCNPHEGRHH